MWQSLNGINFSVNCVEPESFFAEDIFFTHITTTSVSESPRMSFF